MNTYNIVAWFDGEIHGILRDPETKEAAVYSLEDALREAKDVCEHLAEENSARKVEVGVYLTTGQGKAPLAAWVTYQDGRAHVISCLKD